MMGVSIFSFRAFLWLIFRDGDELRVLSPNNLGDMSLHLTFIRYFANGAPFWPDSPIFSAGKLTYAAGMAAAIRSALSERAVNAFRKAIVEDGAEDLFRKLESPCPVARG